MLVEISSRIGVLLSSVKCARDSNAGFGIYCVCHCICAPSQVGKAPRGAIDKPIPGLHAFCSRSDPSKYEIAPLLFSTNMFSCTCIRLELCSYLHFNFPDDVSFTPKHTIMKQQKPKLALVTSLSYDF